MEKDRLLPYVFNHDVLDVRLRNVLAFHGSLQATGKLQGQQLAVTGADQSANIISSSTTTPNLSINTLPITNSHQGITFLIDMEADVSVLPTTAHDKCSTQLSTKLTAANGTLIKICNRMCQRVTLDKQHYKHDQYIAEATQPILGADFSHHHDLPIDA